MPLNRRQASLVSPPASPKRCYEYQVGTCMRVSKCRLFHVCVYQLGLVALTAEVSSPMCPPAAVVCLVPLAQGVPLLVFLVPPRSQCRPCLLLSIGPIGPNLKNQYSCEEQMMQL